MIRSMSGYGRGEASSERHRVNAEIRTVNHRFCPISLRLPTELTPLEEPVRKLVQTRVQRGKVDLTVSVAGASGAAAVDPNAARHWAEQLAGIATELGLAAPTLPDLLPLPGVVVDAACGLDAERDADTVLAAVERALDALDAFRAREGRDLAEDLTARVAAIRDGVERIEETAEELPARVRDSLRERLGELLSEVGADVDETRIVQEAAYYAERADITEELVRLRSHLDKVDAALATGEPVGRALEFLAQELHRELNTIGAKTKDLDIKDTTLTLKAELERIREQVQNVE